MGGARRTGGPPGKGGEGLQEPRGHQPVPEPGLRAFHSVKHDKPAGRLALDDDRPTDAEVRVPWANHPTVPKGLPGTYARLAQYSWAFQSRRSPLIWNVYGKRLDGFANVDVPSPPFDYLDEKSVL